MEDTIVAISTAPGNGGIGIIRLSGEKVFEIIDKIFVPKSKDNKIEGYHIKYGNIINNKNKEIIDEVLVSYFVAPKSYTRENMVEINSHGGIVVEKRILELCIENGAKIAEPGEFTKRAFLNGRIDLAQAEAIMDLINSKSEKEAKESINQLEGKLSSKINLIEKELTDIMVKINTLVDYPEYDIEELEERNEEKELVIIREKLVKLIDSFNQGKLLRDGIKTAIIGKPNAGKSSLLNRILNEERAIVSNIEGTTRDTIEEFININGISLKIIDTAGIREANNEIEKIGVEKSKRIAEKADLIIAIFDISSDYTEEDKQIIDIIKNKTAIIILNKIDIKNENKKLEEELIKLDKPIIKISTLKDEGIEKIYKEIEDFYEFNKVSSDNEILITNERHKNHISKALESVDNALEAFKNKIPTDIASIHITQALTELSEITGKNVSESIINEIFKRFCLGK